jgi:ribonuclease Z
MSVPIKVVLLGSGSSYPTPTRYHPALTITYEGKTVLFDCGEATQIRLQEAGISSVKLDAIFITHMHGDHFFGLPGTIYSMALQGREKPLTVYGPKGVNTLKKLAELDYHRLDFPIEFKEVKSGVIHETEKWFVEAVEVDHGVPALAFAFKEKDRSKVLKSKLKGIKTGPWLKKVFEGQTVTVNGKKIGPEILNIIPGRKIVYSGDCRPTPALIKLARGADLLIHESTYLSSMKDMAEERFHSTSKQAAEIAKKAGVNQLVLFHYSRRYKNSKDLLKEAKEIFPNTKAGKDLMEIKL